MKILLCSPYKGAIGGISRWTRHIEEYYNEFENTNKIYLSIFSLSRTRGVYADTKISQRLLYAFFDYLKIIKRFKKDVSDNEYDVVHIVSSASFGLLKDLALLFYGKKSGAKTIVHFRFGRIPDLFNKNNWEKKLIVKVLKNADKVIVIDEKSLETLRGNGYENVEYLPNPINPNVLKYIEEQANICKNPTKIVFAGHVVRSKGVFELIEAAKGIEGISVSIIGHITEEIKLELLKLVGPEANWLEIKGELEYNETLRAMLTAGIFVLPTYTEGFPNVILESMACSAPIVTTNVGAIPEMLNIKGEEVCGICVEPRKVNELRAAILKMINNPHYAEMCGKNAFKRVIQKYNMPIVWQKLEDIWFSTQ